MGIFLLFDELSCLMWALPGPGAGAFNHAGSLPALVAFFGFGSQQLLGTKAVACIVLI